MWWLAVLLGVVRLIESNNLETGQPANVWTPHVETRMCDMHTWSYKHCAAPEQIFHEKSNGLRCVEHFFYIFASIKGLKKNLMFFLNARQNIISVASTGMEKNSKHSKRCDVRLCIHFVIWLNQKPFHSDLYPLSVSLLITVWLQSPLAHTRTDTNTSGPSLCIPIQCDERKRVGNMWPTLPDTACVFYVWVAVHLCYFRYHLKKMISIFRPLFI